MCKLCYEDIREMHNPKVPSVVMLIAVPPLTQPVHVACPVCEPSPEWPVGPSPLGISLALACDTPLPTHHSADLPPSPDIKSSR